MLGEKNVGIRRSKADVISMHRIAAHPLMSSSDRGMMCDDGDEGSIGLCVSIFKVCNDICSSVACSKITRSSWLGFQTTSGKSTHQDDQGYDGREKIDELDVRWLGSSASHFSIKTSILSMTARLLGNPHTLNQGFVASCARRANDEILPSCN